MPSARTLAASGAASVDLRQRYFQPSALAEGATSKVSADCVGSTVAELVTATVGAAGAVPVLSTWILATVESPPAAKASMATSFDVSAVARVTAAGAVTISSALSSTASVRRADQPSGADSFTCSTPRISTTKRLVAPASNVCTPSVGVTIRQKKSLTIGMRSSSPPSSLI